MNVIFVSHCDFTGNSALHVLAVATELQRRGISPAICVPDNVASVEDPGRPPFSVLTFEEALGANIALFPDGRGADLVHAFTPREHVRRIAELLVSRYHCPYIVHLEDNEGVILRDEIGPDAYEEMRRLPLAISDKAITPWRTHPVRGRIFLEGAAGVTALMDTLLEFKPAHIPGVVFWPGFDEALLESRSSPSLRADYGAERSDFVLAYTGNIHASNLREVQSLYLAIGSLRRAKYPVKLLKTGWNHVDMSWVSDWGVDGSVVDLGFLPRASVGDLLEVSDVLVQPGISDEFNNYRFPSKLPEYLASGKPVVLPQANIGRYLKDGEEAYLLREGDASDIFDAVACLADNSALAQKIGAGGRAFALRELTWKRNVEPILGLYAQVEEQFRGGQASSLTPTKNRNPPVEPPAKAIAFYLPQFHQIPENDAWWGEGFTEWTNTRRAVAQFEGHYQPQSPIGLGYYDLRDHGVLDAQARLARSYGIYGFCFYYYWFNGRRLLEGPLDAMLARGEPDLPFCCCWANENWTRRWDGAEDDILLEQKYSDDWAGQFIRDLLPVLADERYIRVKGSPLLLVYRANLIPNVRAVCERWRKIASREAGISLQLAAVQSFGITDPRPYGFDAAVEFPPHTERFLVDYKRVRKISPEFAGYLEDYRRVMEHELAKPVPEYSWYRGVMPSWDNTARRGSNAHVLIDSSPGAYQTWFRKLVLQAMTRATVDEPLVFVNAWNEWAEGTHLEPDDRYGEAWLEATLHGLRDGMRQYFASMGYKLNPAEALAHLRMTLPPL